jgi:hypothetical protein
VYNLKSMVMIAPKGFTDREKIVMEYAELFFMLADCPFLRLLVRARGSWMGEAR